MLDLGRVDPNDFSANGHVQTATMGHNTVSGSIRRHALT